jgi:CRISPR-associated protein Csh2
MTDIAHRHEILFVYEAQDCNPNGDPLDENRPRTDPETGQATVTDVRIKRTARDYFLAQEPEVQRRLDAGREILIRDTWKNDGYLAQGKDRAESFVPQAAQKKKGLEKLAAVKQSILSSCIDARMFGCALPLGEGNPSLKLTGPVQFMPFNRSLHQVSPVMVQQTAAYAGSAKGTQKSFAERWILPYALICAYGVVNENAARETGMSQSDLTSLFTALWQGTADLNTHSKIGHSPLLLMVVQNEPGYKLGGLNQLVSLRTDIAENKIRSTEDYELDVLKLLDVVKGFSHVSSVQVRQDERLRCVAGENAGSFYQVAKGYGLDISSLE